MKTMKKPGGRTRVSSIVTNQTGPAADAGRVLDLRTGAQSAAEPQENPHPAAARKLHHKCSLIASRRYPWPGNHEKLNKCYLLVEKHDTGGA